MLHNHPYLKQLTLRLTGVCLVCLGEEVPEQGAQSPCLLLLLSEPTEDHDFLAQASPSVLVQFTNDTTQGNAAQHDVCARTRHATKTKVHDTAFLAKGLPPTMDRPRVTGQAHQCPPELRAHRDDPGAGTGAAVEAGPRTRAEEEVAPTAPRASRGLGAGGAAQLPVSGNGSQGTLDQGSPGAILMNRTAYATSQRIPMQITPALRMPHTYPRLLLLPPGGRGTQVSADLTPEGASLPGAPTSLLPLWSPGPGFSVQCGLFWSDGSRTLP